MLCVEIRSYEMKPGGYERLNGLMHEFVVPMLRAAGHDVVYAGASLHDSNAYVLVRAYADESERAKRQGDFYGSAAWQEGPRSAVLAQISAYTSSVLPISGQTLEAWRADLTKPQGDSSAGT